MKHAQTLTALLAIVMFCSFSVFGESLEPLTVSPGATDRMTGVEARCPTFSWQAVPGAVAYEVVVYELPPEVELAGWSLDEAVEVLFVELPVGVTGWTPSLESGLARGADHVWFVRGVFGDDDATEWSEARFFRVAGGMSELGIGLQSREVGESSGAGGGAGEARSRGTKAEGSRNAMAERVGETKTKDVSTAMAAIRGEMPDATGETYGVVGISNSLEGGGLGAVNTAGGPDLVLDGAAAGVPDLGISEWGVDRISPDSEIFAFSNSGGGALDLWVQGDVRAGTLFAGGDEVVTILTDRDTLGSLACANWQVAKWDGANWVCMDDWSILSGLSCAAGEIAKWDGANWVCAPDIDTDTLNDLSCTGGEIAKWDGSNWVCGLDIDTDTDTTYSAGTGMQLVGTEFRAMGSGYANVVAVAASGGDFTSIQAAIDSITTASGSSPYLVWVAPGSHNETVTMKSHVHLQGAGQDVTTIWSTVGNSSPPPSQATLVLASNTSVRDLTVSNLGTDTWNLGMIAGAGTTGALVAEVTVRAEGAGTNNFAILLTDASTDATLRNVTSLAGGASGNNFGLNNTAGAAATLVGGSYAADGGTYPFGISNTSDASLVATDVTALGENGSSENNGLYCGYGATTTLYGGSFIAEGGPYASAIVNKDSGSLLRATAIRARGAGASNGNVGLANSAGAEAVLTGGSFTGDGGNASMGITNDDSGSTLHATNTNAQGLNATTARGLATQLGSETVLNGGHFEAKNGSTICGILGNGSNSTIEAINVVAVAEGGSTSTSGIAGSAGTVKLGGGVFSGYGGRRTCSAWRRRRGRRPRSPGWSVRVSNDLNDLISAFALSAFRSRG